MIDRTRLTQALDKWRNPASFPLEDVEGLTVILNAALWARDFPTDQQVTTVLRFSDDNNIAENGTPINGPTARRWLVAVRDTMIGGSDD